MEASGSPTAWSTLLSGSQMARRPRWTLSTSGPRVRAARGASSGRPVSPGTWLLIREAYDVERQQIMGHPHTAHRDGELTACQVLAPRRLASTMPSMVSVLGLAVHIAMIAVSM